MYKILISALAAIGLCAAAPAMAQDMSKFTPGPVFTDFGPVAAVDFDMPIPPDAHFAVAFDAEKAADGQDRNAGFESGARLINMLAANGVDPGDIRVAIVVHGPALHDLVTDAARKAHGWGDANPSGAMVRDMLAHHVRFIACGQAMTAAGITRADLVPGVEVALSAMVAHALLQQEGYTLNPF